MPEEHLVVMILITGRCYEEDAVLFRFNAILSEIYEGCFFSTSDGL